MTQTSFGQGKLFQNRRVTFARSAIIWCTTLITQHGAWMQPRLSVTSPRWTTCHNMNHHFSGGYCAAIEDVVPSRWKFITRRIKFPSLKQLTRNGPSKFPRSVSSCSSISEKKSREASLSDADILSRPFKPTQRLRNERTPRLTSRAKISVINREGR